MSESEEEEQLKDLAVTLAQQHNGRPVIILMDEIIDTHMLNSLSQHTESVPANVTMIAVVNPLNSLDLPTLPEFVLQINITTPYRSTIAITSLAQSSY